MFSSIVLVAVSTLLDATLVNAQITSAPSIAFVPVPTGSPLPLTDYTYTYPNLPYQVNPFPVGRGPQSGYNICNSTTVGATSECQTLIMNDISDFCLWGSPISNATIGDSEALVVAFCTKDTHGTRLIPPNAIQGVQFMKTDAYIQIVGRIDQTVLGLQVGDFGGELDPHGADLAGNPLGGLVYSNGFGGSNATYTQAISWNNFVGSDIFCIKLCNPAYSTDKNFCQNIYDLIGCAYNMPSSLYNNMTNTFESCEGDLQDEVGTYTGSLNGQTSTWLQPNPTLPADSILPWTPRIPASSNCVTYQSTNIYSVAPTPTPTPTPSPALSPLSGTAGQASGSGGSAKSGASGAAVTGSGSGGSASNPASTASRVSGAGRINAGAGALALVVLGLFV